jgi:hypothetical protein
MTKASKLEFSSFRDIRPILPIRPRRRFLFSSFCPFRLFRPLCP